MKSDEKILLSNSSLDDLIRMKIKEEFTSKLIKKTKLAKTIKDFSKVPKEYIFSKKAVYRVYNRLNHTQSLINGIQADALIGLQEDIREKIYSQTLSAFSTDDAYVVFEKVTL